VQSKYSQHKWALAAPRLGGLIAPAGRAAGFSLLEVLVALVIAALALGALYHSGLTSLQSIHSATRYEQALARARSRLSIALHGAPLAARDLEGDDGDGFRWRVHVTPAATTSVRPYGMHDRDRPTWIPVTLYDVSVLVSWTDRQNGTNAIRDVRLDTQHVEAAAP
jgi:general secretion pathway protein I